MSIEQDWEVKVLQKKPAKKTNAVVNDAIRTGEATTEKKFLGGANKQSEAAVYARKLEEESEDFRHAEIPHQFKVALMQARVAKKWNQKELAQKINEKPSTIQEYETGTAVPNPQIISKLNRVLGVTLPKIPKKKKSGQDE